MCGFFGIIYSELHLFVCLLGMVYKLPLQFIIFHVLSSNKHGFVLFYFICVGRARGKVYN